MHDSPALEGCNSDLNLRCLLWFSVSSPVLASCAWWFMIIASFNGCSHVVLTELCYSWGCRTLQREFSGYDRAKIRAVQMACLDGCTQFQFWDITSIMRIETQLCTKRYCLQGTLSLSSCSFFYWLTRVIIHQLEKYYYFESILTEDSSVPAGWKSLTSSTALVLDSHVCVIAWNPRISHLLSLKGSAFLP